MQLQHATERAAEPPELKLMRHVLKKPATADKTLEQKNYRAWMEGNRNSFMKHYLDLLDQAREQEDPEEYEDYMGTAYRPWDVRPAGYESSRSGELLAMYGNYGESAGERAAVASNGHASPASGDSAANSAVGVAVEPVGPAPVENPAPKSEPIPTFAVRLEGVPEQENVIPVIRAVQHVLRCEWQEASWIVAGAPQIIAKGISRERAATVAKQIRDYGARAAVIEE